VIAQSKWLIAKKKKKKKKKKGWKAPPPNLINRSNNKYSLEKSPMY
jgi:hypothetical protein